MSFVNGLAALLAALGHDRGQHRELLHRWGGPAASAYGGHDCERGRRRHRGRDRGELERRCYALEEPLEDLEDHCDCAAAPTLRRAGLFELLPHGSARGKEQRLDGGDTDFELGRDLFVGISLELPQQQGPALWSRNRAQRLRQLPERNAATTTLR